MKCPDCLEKIHDRADECPHCGTTLTRIHSLYQGIDTNIENGILDIAGVLNNESRKQLRKTIQSQMKQFVGINLAISFISLKNDQTLETYGFWLINQGIFHQNGRLQNGAEEGQGRVIIIVDVENKQVGISYGYLLDGCIRDKENFNILSAGHASLLEGDMLQGSILIISALKANLIKAVARAKKGDRK